MNPIISKIAESFVKQAVLRKTIQNQYGQFQIPVLFMEYTAWVENNTDGSVGTTQVVLFSFKKSIRPDRPLPSSAMIYLPGFLTRQLILFAKTMSQIKPGLLLGTEIVSGCPLRHILSYLAYIVNNNPIEVVDYPKIIGAWFSNDH